MHHIKPIHSMAGVLMASMKQAISRELGVLDLMTTAERLQAAGAKDLVLELYKAWLQHNSDNPLAYAVAYNFGVLLSDTGQRAQARDALLEAIRLNPGFIPPYINLGTALEQLGDLDGAVAQWMHVAEALGSVTPDNLDYRLIALKQVGRALEIAHRDWQSEQALRQSLELDPHQRDVAQHWIALRQGQCKWPVLETWGKVTRERLLLALSPLSAAAYRDDPMFQFANAHQYYNEEIADFSRPFSVGRFAPPERWDSRKLRVGYVSSDLRDHAVGFLTGEVYELHDRNVIDVFAYYCGPAVQNSMHQRIRASVDCWRELGGLSDKQAARLIVADEIDILVDLNGYTKDARTKVFALRPAPVIVNWLGYPGTMGTPHHDYIIADPFIIPPASEHYYSEQVVRLPCYQPTDRKRAVASTCPSRAEAGLPAEGTVFCCFNGHQKITQTVFQRWMAILQGVPNSVLWLLRPGDATAERLRQYAKAAGIDPGRILFAEKQANPEHLARYPLADLFLDTSPYGAHTTTSDALWMGVPVLTVAGRGFASRVCGSLVTAAGLPDLVCPSFDAYVRQAIELGRDPRALAMLRSRVRASRSNSTLFDTPGLVRALEALYQEMWQNFLHGRIPQPDMTNLDVYLDIGCKSAEETAFADDDPAYCGYYETMMAYRHQLRSLPNDRHFWTAEAMRRTTNCG